MSDRQERILQILTSGPASSFYIANQLDAPLASVRRDIQSLRKLGHRIDDARDFAGVYRLVAA